MAESLRLPVAAAQHDPPTPRRSTPRSSALGVRGSRRAPVRTLSQGQRRRVALARLALSLEQPLWLLDEPFDALDADGVRGAERPAGRPCSARRRQRAAHQPPAAEPGRAGAADLRPRPTMGSHDRVVPCRAAARPAAGLAAAHRLAVAAGLLHRRREPVPARRRTRSRRRCAKSRRASSGSARCWRRCCRSMPCSPATWPTARSNRCCLRRSR